MLKKSDLQKQNTFTETNNEWFDGMFGLLLSNKRGGGLWKLYQYCEVNGESEYLTDIRSIDELKQMYELYTHLDFE